MQFALKLFRAIKERVYDAVVFHYYAHNARKRKRKYVVMGNPMVGIGNRLIALANTYSWHGKENITLIWAMDHWVSEPFENLFEMTDAPGFEVISHKRNRWSRHIQIPTVVERTSTWWQFWAPPAFMDMLPQKTLRYLCASAPRWFWEIYGAFFRQLKPSKAVQKRIDECKVPEDVICVQIRNTIGKRDIARVASPKTFIDIMRRYGRNQKFFISCMEPSISKTIHDEFGNQIIELPNKDYGSMVDAVADMWILGHTKILIAQKPSSFSEIAYWWGQGNAEMIAVDYEYQQTT